MDFYVAANLTKKSTNQKRNNKKKKTINFSENMKFQFIVIFYDIVVVVILTAKVHTHTHKIVELQFEIQSAFVS